MPISGIAGSLGKDLKELTKEKKLKRKNQKTQNFLLCEIKEGF